MDSQKPMTVVETSEYLRLAQSTVYKLLETGQIPGRKVGGSWRVPRRALDKWLEGEFSVQETHQEPMDDTAE